MTFGNTPRKLTFGRITSNSDAANTVQQIKAEFKEKGDLLPIGTQVSLSTSTLNPHSLMLMREGNPV